MLDDRKTRAKLWKNFQNSFGIINKINFEDLQNNFESLSDIILNDTLQTNDKQLIIT